MNAKQIFREWHRAARAPGKSYNATVATVNGRRIGLLRINSTRMVHAAPKPCNWLHHTGTAHGYAFGLLSEAVWNCTSRFGSRRLARGYVMMARRLPGPRLP